MTCTSCGAQNDPGRKFCLECGTALAAVCGACGASNPAAAKFCGECGGRLGGGAGAASGGAAEPGGTGAVPPVAVVAERRLVSVLFADMVGFTTLAEQRDAEEVRDLLSRYFELARGIVERHGGTIEKFIGDAVMAVWGTPTSHEDDAERAVRAALQLVAAVRELGPSVQARAGVLTGEAAVTIGAVGEGMVAGDMVNTASRLQAAAPPGAVLVGEATMNAASRAIAFEEAGEQLLKGKVAPVPAWRALRVVAERGGRGRSEGLEAPFVGRDDELRLLEDLYHATARDRRVRLVSITGQGGIGKSRLAWEFLKYIDGLSNLGWNRAVRALQNGDLAASAAGYLESGRRDPYNAVGAFGEAAFMALLASERALVETAGGALSDTESHAAMARVTLRLVDAGIAAFDGNPEAARTGLLTAYAALRNLGAARKQALTGLAMATLLDTSDPLVRAAIDESRHLFEQMGAGLWLARLDGALADTAASPAPVSSTPVSPAPA